MTSNITSSDKGHFSQHLVIKSFVLKGSSILVNVNVVISDMLSIAVDLYLGIDHCIYGECFYICNSLYFM